MNIKFTFRSGALLMSLMAILFAACSVLPTAQAPIRVVIIGGGSAHAWSWNYNTDSATLAKGGFATVKYVGTRRDRVQMPFNPDSASTKDILAAIPQADVLYITTNNQFNDPRLREALMKHVSSGKGIVFGHAGGWHNHGAQQVAGRGGTPIANYTPWPEYNTIFLNGGTRGHDRAGQAYNVVVTDSKHQIMQGVTRTTFPVTDELYYAKRDSVSATAPGWNVLATATSTITKITWPQVMTINNPKGKLVNITLGHDAGSHDVPEFQTILRNSVAWAAGKKNPK